MALTIELAAPATFHGLVESLQILASLGSMKTMTGCSQMVEGREPSLQVLHLGHSIVRTAIGCEGPTPRLYGPGYPREAIKAILRSDR
jgi:hypothetical protein